MKVLRIIFLLCVFLPIVGFSYVYYKESLSPLAKKTETRRERLKSFQYGLSEDKIKSELGTSDLVDSSSIEGEVTFLYKTPPFSSGPIAITFMNDSTVSYYDGN